MVLTGGRSSRMGADKASLIVGDKALVRYSINALVDAGASRVLVVGNWPSGLGAADVDVIADRFPDQGPLGGIVTAFKATSAPMLVVLPCDVPGVDAAFVRAMTSALDSEPDSDAAVPVAEGHRQAVTVAFRRRAERAVTNVFESGARSAQAALDSISVVEISVGDSPLADLNDPEQLSSFTGEATDDHSAGLS